MPARPGHGTTGNGRTVINIAPDNTWTAQQAATISQAISDACSAWNGQATCGNTPYSCTPVNSVSVADVIVTRDDTASTCANTALMSISGTNRSSTPDQIHLRTLVANNEASAARTIAHELGHVTGLSNSGDDSQCKGALSIMSLVAPLTTCISSNVSVTANDVAQINKSLSTPSQCNQDVYHPPSPEPTTNCPRATQCPREDPNYYAPDGISDPCQNGGNGCENFSDVVIQGCCYESLSPIIVDVSHAGFHLTDPANGVLFDFKSTGVPQQVSWIAPGAANGWLVLDRDGDGKITSGKELFGNYTPQTPSDNPNGFLALAEFDKAENGGNGDGLINSQDAVFAKLRIWTDVNHNGVSEPSELHPLDEFGITGIELGYKLTKWQDAYGNLFRFKGRILRNGAWEDHTIYDVLILSVR